METCKISVSLEESSRKVLDLRGHVWPGSNGTARAWRRDSVSSARSRLFGLFGCIPLDEVSVGGQVKRVETLDVREAVHRLPGRGDPTKESCNGGKDRGRRRECCLVIQAFPFQPKEIRLETQNPDLAS